MKIFIASDHGGFTLKTKLVEYLKEKNLLVEDVGPTKLDPLDDYPDYGKKVAQRVALNPAENRGILLCRNGVGMDIMANRFRNVRCVLGFHTHQIEKARKDDNVNVLALPADYITQQNAHDFVDIFLSTQPDEQEKYSRRVRKIDL